MLTYPSVEESRQRLERAGWSAEVELWTFPVSGPRYRVVVCRGGRAVSGDGDSAAEAWWQAGEQAEAVGRPAPPAAARGGRTSHGERGRRRGPPRPHRPTRP